MDKLDNDTVAALERRAFDLRADNLTTIAASASGHPGGTLSAMDIMQTLFFVEMQHRPAEPHWPDRDRLVLSKGHAVPALYTVMAHAGYFSRDRLPTLRQLGSPLQGHPANFLMPGIEASTGSLGQGFSVAHGHGAGVAKLDGASSRVYMHDRRRRIAGGSDLGGRDVRAQVQARQPVSSSSTTTRAR